MDGLLNFPDMHSSVATILVNVFTFVGGASIIIGALAYANKILRKPKK